jgi:adenine specific DNA methylase Mod
MYTPEEQYIRDRIKSPMFNGNTRTWDVEYLEGNKWVKQSFNSHSQAYNFYLDKWDFHSYWFQTLKAQGKIRS